MTIEEWRLFDMQKRAFERAKETRLPILCMGLTWYPPSSDGIAVVGPAVRGRGYDEITVQ